MNQEWNDKQEHAWDSQNTEPKPDATSEAAPNWAYRPSGTAAPQPNPPKKSNTGRTIGIIAVILAVIVCFGALTAGCLYLIGRAGDDLAQRLERPPTTTVSQTDTPATSMPDQTTLPSANNRKPTPAAPARQTTPAKNTTPNPAPNSSVQNPHFSLEEAAGKHADGKKTLSTIEIAALGKQSVVGITSDVTTSFFGRQMIGKTAGSGFIISQDGYIVTNNHVVENSRNIVIMLDDGTSYVAVIVGRDAANDIAVLKVNATDLTPVILGNSSELQVGELAMAIGNPLGVLTNSVTVGVISGLDRELEVESGQHMTLLQTDAAINQGNSGGALFNSFGEVIGINTVKNTGTGIEGLGFAIPIDHAKPIIESLIREGTRRQLVIGITIIEITEADAANNSDLRAGIGVASVASNSPAAEAGIKAYDIIIAANGKKVTTAAELNAIKDSLRSGDALELTVFRNRKEIKIKVILREQQINLQPAGAIAA